MPIQIIDDDCLPSEYMNVICKDKSVGKRTLVRVDLRNIEDINNWVKLFGRKTNTYWAVSASVDPKSSKVYWRKFVCHHDSLRNAHSKENKEELAKRCKASILIVMKPDHNPVRKNHENIKKGMQAMIKIECEHNHPFEITNTDQHLQATSDIENGCLENIRSQTNSATELCNAEATIIIEKQNIEESCAGKNRTIDKLVTFPSKEIIHKSPVKRKRSTDESLTVPSKKDKSNKYVRRKRTIKVEITSSSGRSVVGSFSSSKPFEKISKNMVNNIIPLVQSGVLLAERRCTDNEGGTTVGPVLPSAFQVTPYNSETESEESDLETTIYLDPDRFDKVESATKGGEDACKQASKDVRFRINRKEQGVRYFGDIKYKHIEDPQKRVQCWQIIQKTYSEKMQHIKSLQDTLKTLKEQFYELKGELHRASQDSS